MAKSSTFANLLHGAVAGFAATFPMSLVMLGWHRRLPWYQRYSLPPKQIVGDLAEIAGIRHRTDGSLKNATTVVSHFAYGACMGLPYPEAKKFLPGAPPATGAGYGFIVWFANYLVGLPAANFRAAATREPLRRSAMMIVSHLVWGAALGMLYAYLTSGDPGTQRKSVRHRGA